MINEANILKATLSSKDIPELFHIAINKNNPFNFRHDAIIALGKIGLAAIPKLSIILQDTQPQYREAALRAISDIGPAAEAMIPKITKLLEDEDRAVRIEAELALGKIGGKSLRSKQQTLQDKWRSPR